MTDTAKRPRRTLTEVERIRERLDAAKAKAEKTRGGIATAEADLAERKALLQEQERVVAALYNAANSLSGVPHVEVNK